jgi:uncharacterized UBP type Zn finger protein
MLSPNESVFISSTSDFGTTLSSFKSGVSFGSESKSVQRNRLFSNNKSNLMQINEELINESSHLNTSVTRLKGLKNLGNSCYMYDDN